jgi:hypothetical protein
MSERTPHTESELVELLRSIDVPAPDGLHQRIDALIDERSSPKPRRRRRAQRFTGLSSLGWRLGAAGTLLIAAVALAVGLPSGGSTALSVREASALTLRPATMPAPPESRDQQNQLAEGVDGVAFPYWEESFGWRSSGARTDRLGGRTVTTVFYTDGRGRRLGYAIVAGTPALKTSGGTVTWIHGTSYRLLSEHGVKTVAWLRDGHLCVMSGHDLSDATLLALASWNER